MKTKNLFNLNQINENNSIYIILPEITVINLVILNKCINFLDKYEQIIFLCPYFEFSFYQFIIRKSSTFTRFKNKIDVEIINHHSFNTLQSTKCIILSLRYGYIQPILPKKAILCSSEQNSDLVFTNQEQQTPLNYLNALFAFLKINETIKLESIDLNANDVINSSMITNTQKGKKFHVMIFTNLYGTMKLSNHLKKNKLQHNLIVISKKNISINDKKLFYFSEYTYLDLLAFGLSAETIYLVDYEKYKNIVNNLHLSLSQFSRSLDFQLTLVDITVPKAE